MLNPFRACLLASTVLLVGSMAVRADVSLGITVKPAPGGGLKVKSVAPNGLGDDLGLKKGETILTVGNPQENVPDMFVSTRKELELALQSIGDHVRLLILDGKTFSFVEGDVDEADPVSFKDEEDLGTTTFVALKKSKPKGALEKVHKVKPKSVTQLLHKFKKKVKKQPRVVRKTVKRTQTHAPVWHPASKGKGKDKDKGKKSTNKGASKVLSSRREDRVV